MKRFALIICLIAIMQGNIVAYECVEYRDVDVLVALDHSSSMAGAPILQASQFAANLFIEFNNTGYLDKRGAFRFCGLVPLPNEYTRMGHTNVNSIANELINGAQSYCLGGWDGTALYDAIHFGAHELFTYSSSNTRVLIIVTDGFDDGSSSVTLNTAASALNRPNLITELIFVGSGSVELQQIASLGGTNAHYRYADYSQLDSLIQDIIEHACKNHRPKAAMNISDSDLHLGVEGFTITFDGSPSSDYETSDSGLTFLWTFTRPDGTEFTNGGKEINKNFDDSQLVHGETWSVRLKVTDPEGETDNTSTKTFRVIGSEPDISINGQTEINVLENINLNVSPDYDLDGGGDLDIVWDIVSCPRSSLPPPQNGSQFSIPNTTEEDIGEWHIKATATDNEGDSGSDDVIVKVINIPPKINFVGSHEIDIGEIIEVSTTILTDEDGGDLTFSWDIIQAPQSSTLGVQRGYQDTDSDDSRISIPTGYDEAGTWIFKLTATDNDNMDNSEVSEKFVVLVDAPPEAVITGPEMINSLMFPLKLQANDSVDPDSPCPDDPNRCHDSLEPPVDNISGDIATYTWSLVDIPFELWGQYTTGRVDDVFGIPANNSTISLNYGDIETGEWTFQLKVIDYENNEDYTTFSVLVIDANTKPYALINAPKRYLVDISGQISQDITLSGSQSYDLDNLLLGDPMAPGLGIDNYEWQVIEAPTGCTPPLLPSGQGEHTIHLYNAGDIINPVCQGYWRIALTVADDDAPDTKTSTSDTTVIIGNCPQDLCIDYPTNSDPQYVEFTEDTDILIYYHLNSVLYDDQSFNNGMITLLEIFHQSDLTTPVYTSYDLNVLASDKGGYLVFHWNGYSNTFERPKVGFYDIRISLLDYNLGRSTFATEEPKAIWIEVSEPNILASSDQYIDFDALDGGVDQITINYILIGNAGADDLQWRVFDASDSIIANGSVQPVTPGTINWDGQISGSTIVPGTYAFELEAYQSGASLGKSSKHLFTVLKIEIEEIMGLYKDDGTYQAGYTSGDGKGRIYCNRVYNPTDLNNAIWTKNKQYIDLKVKIEPINASLPSDASIVWEVKDPDDPSNEDPNVHNDDKIILDFNDYDGADNDGDGAIDNSDGNDNTGGRDGAPPWEQVHSDYALTANKTQIKNGISKVRFNATDDAGDNFIIKARLKPGAAASPFKGNETGNMTVWKKINLEYVKMTSADPLPINGIAGEFKKAFVQMDIAPVRNVPDIVISGKKVMGLNDNTAYAKCWSYITRANGEFSKEGPGWFFLAAANEYEPLGSLTSELLYPATGTADDATALGNQITLPTAIPVGKDPDMVEVYDSTLSKSVWFRVKSESLSADKKTFIIEKKNYQPIDKPETSDAFLNCNLTDYGFPYNSTIKCRVVSRGSYGTSGISPGLAGKSIIFTGWVNAATSLDQIVHELTHALSLAHKCGNWDFKSNPQRTSCCMNYNSWFILNNVMPRAPIPWTNNRAATSLCSSHIKFIRGVNLEDLIGLGW